MPLRSDPSRRALLAALPLAGLGTVAGSRPAMADTPVLRLTAAAGDARLAGPDGPVTPFLGYDGRQPGPVIRVRRGETLAVDLRNDLAEPTQLHWHGLRRGAADVASLPLQPGATARHAVTPRDAGTFLYRPHLAGGEDQLRRGLAGLLIVDDARPPVHDREIAMLLSEVGSTGTTPVILVDGKPDLALEARPNERLWLRLANGTAHRILQMTVPDQALTLVALDSQPCEPFRLDGGRLLLAPGQRAEIMWDVAGPAGTDVPVTIVNFAGTNLAGRLAVGGSPLREAPLGTLAPLPPNPLPQAMDFRRATRLDLAVATGVAGVVTFGGRSERSTPRDPLIRIRRGAVVTAALRNDTAQFQAIHIEGHPARLLDGLDDGWKPFFLDTVLIAPATTARIAFLAETAGRFLMTAQAINDPQGPLVAAFEVG
ncbi:MAG: multicopper oxidase family protein [Phreatobacter sp.]|nr:multicopper oxidase family protein [Phreatobacter sp.]